MQASLALEVRNLSCGHGASEILRDISLDVGRGSVCGLLGPNGSGKTTLFRCLLNFHKIFTGDVRICGQATKGLAPARMARLVSYVPQEHHSAFPFPAADLVRMGRNPLLERACGFGREHERAAWDAMKLLGIADLADQPYASLSGGQRQLVLIARAVAQQAPLMLLDEPTSALDFQNQLEVWKALRQLAGLGFTMVVCCHDPNHILWFCDQTVLLKQGRILAAGATETVLTKEALNKLYGGICMSGELPGGLQVVYPALLRQGSGQSSLGAVSEAVFTSV